MSCAWVRQVARPEAWASLPPLEAHGWSDRCPDSQTAPKAPAPTIMWLEKGCPAGTPFPKLLWEGPVTRSPPRGGAEARSVSLLGWPSGLQGAGPLWTEGKV